MYRVDLACLAVLAGLGLAPAAALRAEQHGDGYGPRNDDDHAYGGGQGTYLVAPLVAPPYAWVPISPYVPPYAPAPPYASAPPGPAFYGAPPPDGSGPYAPPWPRWRALPPLRPPPLYPYPAPPPGAYGD